VAQTLTFAVLHEYDAGEGGITIPVRLSIGQQFVQLPAKLDTGCSYCIFQRGYGESLGLDIESGQPEHIGTPTGSFLAYGHGVTLSVLGFQFDVMVYFAAMPDFPRDVLGRHGWLQQVKLGLIDYEGKLYLGAYNDPS